MQSTKCCNVYKKFLSIILTSANTNSGYSRLTTKELANSMEFYTISTHQLVMSKYKLLQYLVMFISIEIWNKKKCYELFPIGIKASCYNN